jgi:hypothetical protein
MTSTTWGVSNVMTVKTGCMDGGLLFAATLRRRHVLDEPLAGCRVSLKILDLVCVRFARQLRFDVGQLGLIYR